MDIEQELALLPAAVDPRRIIIKGLRDFASFLEDHPTMPGPAYIVCINAFAKDRAELAQAARLGGWRKDYGTSWFSLSRNFGGDKNESYGVQFDISIPRHEVCHQVVVGTEVVPEQPAREAIPEHTVDKIEWVCDDAALLRGK